MAIYKSFDVTTLKVGDVIHFGYKFSDDMISLITNINYVDEEDGNDYTLTLKSGSRVTYSAMDLSSIVESNAYRIRKPLAGLELI